MRVYLARQSATTSFLAKDSNMANRAKSPIIIRFSSPKEAIDLSMKIELKYFIARLLYTSPKAV